LDYIQTLNKGSKVVILITFKQHANRDVKEELNILVQKGFSRIVNSQKEPSSITYRIEELLDE